MRSSSLVRRTLPTGSRGCAAENAGTLKARCLDCCRSLCWAKGHRCFGTTTSSSHPTTPVMPEDPPTPPRYFPPPLTLPVAPSPPLGLYARFRLPSRFRKLEGLSFISANWMEYSWPFQWNQLTPCKDKDEVWEVTHSLLLLSDFTAPVSDCRLFSNSGTEAQQRLWEAHGPGHQHAQPIQTNPHAVPRAVALCLAFMAGRTFCFTC